MEQDHFVFQLVTGTVAGLLALAFLLYLERRARITDSGIARRHPEEVQRAKAAGQ